MGELFCSHEAASLFMHGSEIDTGTLTRPSPLGTHSLCVRTAAFACSSGFIQKVVILGLRSSSPNQ